MYMGSKDGGLGAAGQGIPSSSFAPMIVLQSQMRTHLSFCSAFLFRSAASQAEPINLHKALTRHPASPDPTVRGSSSLPYASFDIPPSRP